MARTRQASVKAFRDSKRLWVHLEGGFGRQRLMVPVAFDRNTVVLGRCAPPITEVRERTLKSARKDITEVTLKIQHTAASCPIFVHLCFGATEEAGATADVGGGLIASTYRGEPWVTNIEFS